jgi:hypothetical protein
VWLDHCEARRRLAIVESNVDLDSARLALAIQVNPPLYDDEPLRPACRLHRRRDVEHYVARVLIAAFGLDVDEDPVIYIERVLGPQAKGHGQRFVGPGLPRHVDAQKLHVLGE